MMFDLPEISVRRGGVRYPASLPLVATGGWCAPAFAQCGICGKPVDEAHNRSGCSAPPVATRAPCDGNHDWRRYATAGGCQCTMCVPEVPDRMLECANCDAEVREGDDGFEELWEAAQW